jgi:hypothetical protein
MVLLETALAIPLLAAVAVALAWGVSLAGTSVALADAARQAARDVARGVSATDAVASAQAAVQGSHVWVEDAGSSVVVVAERDVAGPGPVLRGISMTLSQRVAVPREWS